MVKLALEENESIPDESLEVFFERDGFSKDEWLAFEKDGLLLRSGVLGRQEVEELRFACEQFERIAGTVVDKVEGGFRHSLGFHSAFARLICDSRLLGPAYDLFGEQTALHGFDIFIRPSSGDKIHSWHFDGPRRLPYSTFFPKLPPVLKFGVWLTDVVSPDDGAYQYVPGSHRYGCGDAYGRSDALPAQRDLLPRAGDVSIHHADLWHRVSPNRASRTRYSFFIAYSPSWISPRERFDDVEARPELPALEPLLRRYEDLTHRIKPPAGERPLHPRSSQALLEGDRLGEPPIYSRIRLWSGR
jgi:hypothetical protein